MKQMYKYREDEEVTETSENNEGKLLENFDLYALDNQEDEIMLDTQEEEEDYLWHWDVFGSMDDFEVSEE